jgi:PST family polysaccharide transporter
MTDNSWSTDQLNLNIGERSISGGIATVIGQGLSFIINLGSTMILARLLTPADFGLISMVTAIIGFVALFKDLGLSMATIQHESLNRSQVNSLFWMNLFISAILTIVVSLLAPLVADFYDEPKLIGITMVLATTFLVGGVSTQHRALLHRNMEFRKLVISDTISLGIGSALAVFLAFSGVGYWALIAKTIAVTLFATIFVWIICKWKPGMPELDRSAFSLLRFGGNVTGFNALNYFSRNLDNVLIGRFWGPDQLGLYSRAYQLLLLPLHQINTPIGAVAIPALSRLYTTSASRYRDAYLNMLRLVLIATVPLVGFFMATSDWMVLIALGPEWSDASKIFFLLGFIGLVQPAASTTGWLFISQGRTKQMLQWGVFSSLVTIISFTIGLPWGALGVAASYSLVGLFIRTPFLFWFIGRHGPVPTREIYKALVVPFSTAVVVFFLVRLSRKVIELQALWGLILGFVILGLCAGIAVLLSQDTRVAIKVILEHFAREKKHNLIEETQS